jgi:hypothetical protein
MALSVMFLLAGLLVIGCTPAEEIPKTSGEVMKIAKY